MGDLFGNIGNFSWYKITRESKKKTKEVKYQCYNKIQKINRIYDIGILLCYMITEFI